MITQKIILVFTFSIISQLLFSKTQDNILLNKELNQLKIKKHEINTELVSSKILPNSRDKTVIVIHIYT